MKDDIFKSCIETLSELDTKYDLFMADIKIEKLLEEGDYQIIGGVKWFVTKVVPKLEFSMGFGYMTINYEWEKENNNENNN